MLLFPVRVVLGLPRYREVVLPLSGLQFVRRLIFCIFLLIYLPDSISAQKSKLRKAPEERISFLNPPDSINRGRLIGVSSTIGATYGGALVGLNYLWYKGFPRSRFHFFNDNKEWLQVDKLGHAFTAYFESAWTMRAFRWAGVDDKRSAWLGAGTGFLLQTTIEIMDAFSAEWGASAGDIAANTLGSAMVIGQELAWQEQRFVVKYSFHIHDDPDEQLRKRAESLYGSSFTERLIKDYNQLDLWLSMNLNAFTKKEMRLPWLNIAVGYGAGDVYGGFANRWEDENGNLVDRSDIERYRKFLISVDADFTRIKTNSPGLKFFLHLANIVKMPAPAVEFNTKGEIIFHPLYFLNWNYPIGIKK